MEIPGKYGRLYDGFCGRHQNQHPEYTPGEKRGFVASVTLCPAVCALTNEGCGRRVYEPHQYCGHHRRQHHRSDDVVLVVKKYGMRKGKTQMREEMQRKCGEEMSAAREGRRANVFELIDANPKIAREMKEDLKTLYGAMDVAYCEVIICMTCVAAAYTFVYR